MATILDQYGKPIEQRILYEPQTAQMMNLQREYAAHPARGLTPMKLARILEEAERGYLQAQTDLFLDMEERDGHILAEMNKRKRALLARDWSIEPPDNANAQEKSNAAFLKELVANAPDLKGVFLDALDALGHGFSNLEIEWQLVGKTWLPKTITHRPQSWFQVSKFNQNVIHLRDYSPDGAELQPFGWVRHVHKAKSGYIARAGLHRALAWPYLFKNYAVRDLAELLEIYGIPLRLGKYPSGAGEEEKRALLRAVTQLGHSAAGIIPESMAIEFHEVAQGSEIPFQTMYDLMERTQSKVILGGTLTSQADGKSSTNALGNVHNEVRHELTESDGEQLGPTISRDLFYPMLVLNGRTVDSMSRVPKCVIDVREPEDVVALADSVEKLVGVNMPVPVSWAQRKFNIPAPQGDEPLLKATQPPAPTPAAPLPPGQAANRGRLQAALAILRGIDSPQPFQDQVQMDRAIDQLGTDGTLQRQAADLLSQVVARLQAAESADAALGVLAELFPDMNDNQLQEALANMLFAADLVGRLTADDGGQV